METQHKQSAGLAQNGRSKMATKWSKRPKWAKPLSAADWKHLCEDAFDGRPTLRGFWRNRRYQINYKNGCYECESIARKLVTVASMEPVEV